jgi:hypothetical protein
VEEARWGASSSGGGGEIGGRRRARERAGGVGGVLSGGVRMEQREVNGRIREERKEKKLNIKENIIGREQRKINRKKKKRHGREKLFRHIFF